MKNKIKNFIDLVNELSEFNSIKMHVNFNINDFDKNKLVFNKSFTFKTNAFFGCSNDLPSYIRIYYPNTNLKYCTYINKKDLVYNNDGYNSKDLKSRVVLKRPSYDQVYEFFYYQYKNLSGLLSVKPSYLEVVNSIYKRKIKMEEKKNV